MSKKMLIARPKYDPITTHLHYWGKVVLNNSNKCNVTAYDLAENKCTRKEVSGHIRKLNPRFLVFHTHGDENTIYGNIVSDKEEILVRLGDNDSLLNGRITYSIACSSAKNLGRKCNSLAFIGYSEDFIFYYMQNRLSRPSTDPVASPNLESTTQIPISIMKGHSVKEAVDKAKMKYVKNIKKQLGSMELEAPYVLQSLIDNMNNLEVFGNKNEKM